MKCGCIFAHSFTIFFSNIGAIAPIFEKKIVALTISIYKYLIKIIKYSKVNEMKNLSYTLRSNSLDILNYFVAKETNAKAETLNMNMKRFININYGARNEKFFFFRLSNYFS